MLDSLPAVRHACDVDLLMFFYRHPCALLTGEQLVSYLGYERERLVKSLETLIEAGLVTRSQNPSRTARLYALELESVPGGLLSRFLEIATTRSGRQQVMNLLGSGASRRPAATLRRRPSIAKLA
jgi:hypothetical protein